MNCFRKILALTIAGTWLFACGGDNNPIILTDTSEDAVADVPLEDNITPQDIPVDRMEDSLEDMIGQDNPAIDMISDGTTDAVNDNADDAETDVVVTGCLSNDDCVFNDGEIGLCNYAYCDRGTGLCSIEDLADDTVCEIPNACWSVKRCKAGECTGVAISCDDFNPCTDDSCDPTNGCIYADNIASCDDGNACTAVDACNEGTCTGTQNTCNCAAIGDCTSHEDGNPCNGTLICKDLKCEIDPNTIVVCTQDPTNPCSRSVCDSANGQCKDENVNNGMSCEDGDLCTTDDLCGWGECNGGPAPECNDDNVCTTDKCDSDEGCVYTNVDGDCNDGNACTTGDTCAEGECAGTGQLNCNDNNPCTTDSCDPATGCVNANITGSCNDGDVCTVGDQCTDGVCTGGTAIVCNDDNVCTDDSCNPETGCVFTNNTDDCNDGSVCTAKDTCEDGKCVGGSPIDCDDENKCTDETCDPVSGCQYVKLTTACSDDNACTVGDVCDDGDCVPGPTANCDDNEFCTEDSCDESIGCLNTPKSSDTLCDDDNGCTVNDKCSAGRCVGVGQTCDDSNQCTTDGCDPINGCSHFPYAGSCNDGEICTVNDYCENSQCKAGPTDTCDDNNVCTTDSCTAGVGCKHVNNTVSCDDGNLCTINDKCSSRRCIGTKKTCNDGLPCTNDFCDTNSGLCDITYVASGTTCNTNLCMENMACNATGACTGGTAKNCNDNNGCTADSCNTTTGACVNAVQTGLPCNDSSNCTVDDACSSTGTCAGSAKCSTLENPRCRELTGGCYCGAMMVGHTWTYFTCDETRSSTCDTSTTLGECKCGDLPQCATGQSCRLNLRPLFWYCSAL